MYNIKQKYLSLRKISKMKKLNILLYFLVCFLPFCTYAQKITSNDIVIIFDNDVHGHMEGYPKMAGMRKDVSRITPNVCLVSLGDFSQGGPFCSVSHGQYAVDVMNRIGYDYTTLGNHEFDYGLDQLNQLVQSLRAKVLVSNYIDAKTKQPVYQSNAIRQIGKYKIGFIGCTTPVTKTSDSPQSFIDKDGNDLYSFCRDNFFEVIQRNVDEVRSMGADYIILLAHLGDVGINLVTSEETIRNTHGIDFVLDGHAHHIIESRIIKNSEGKDVLLSSTGAHFLNIGRLIISEDGKARSELIPIEKYTNEDPEIAHLISSFNTTFDRLPTIATSEYDLAGFDRIHDTYDRNCQTNLGSLCADAFRIMSNADIGWVNAGGVRNSIPAGRITFKELLGAFPFENRICVAEFTGQQILDALEFGVYRAPDDNGSFPQVSGITYDLNTSVTANILFGTREDFAGIGEGPRRISNVKVLNKNTKRYEPLDPKKTYTLASINFILRNRGCNGILANGNIIADDQMIDTQLIENYLNFEQKGVISEAYKEVRTKLPK